MDSSVFDVDPDPGSCPECDDELVFTGIQPAGIGQFFCETCHHRRDRYVGNPTAAGGEDATDGAVRSDPV
jgi:hypothetical protein